MKIASAIVYASLVSMAPLAASSGRPNASAIRAASAPQPVEMTTVIEGRTFHYFVYGDFKSGRTPLLILHGAYMSSDGMRSFAERFARTRPVIVPDQRGFGRTGDVPGPITYERLADDAAAVLAAANVRQADVLGYSIGGGAAIQLAIRHPERVMHLVEVSASYNKRALYGSQATAESNITAATFAGTPIERDYKRLSPDPSRFPVLVDKMNAMTASPQDWSPQAIKGIRAKTMVVSGDNDIIRPEHSVELFRLRGGAPEEMAAKGFLTEAPATRLAILPGTAHLGVLAQADLVVALVTPFLDDAKPAMPEGFF